MAKEQTLAMALICSSDRSKYGTLITDLANQYAMGRNEYPANIVAAKSMSVMYKTPTNAPANNRIGNTQSQPALNPKASAMTFA
jgi:hypothetical protein